MNSKDLPQDLTYDQMIADIRAAMIGAERPEGYYTVTEWANKLKLSDSTVIRYIKDGLEGYTFEKLDNVLVQTNRNRIKTTVYKITKNTP